MKLELIYFQFFKNIWMVKFKKFKILKINFKQFSIAWKKIILWINEILYYIIKIIYRVWNKKFVTIIFFMI